MKNIVFIFCFSLLFLGLNQNGFTQEDQGKIELNPKDSVEYELIILDAKFDAYLISIAKPIEFYTNDYYRSRNNRYVQEWNKRHSDPLSYGDFYETHIDYNPFTDYGLKLNYQLYNYFQFIEHEYDIDLNVR